MINDAYNLKDYSALAYEFAIRNPRVIQLLGIPLTDETVKELLSYGINATSCYDYHDEDGNLQTECINSLQELYLDYAHLRHLDHRPHSPCGEGRWQDEETGEEYNDFRGRKLLIHPKSRNKYNKSENSIDALKRIAPLIESRGNKLSRLMSGDTFISYDEVIFFENSVYSLDPSKSRTKTINADIDFVKKWIDPQQYLQLLPKCAFLL